MLYARMLDNSFIKWIRAVDLNKKMVADNNIDYRAMSGSSSQQILNIFP